MSGLEPIMGIESPSHHFVADPTNYYYKLFSTLHWTIIIDNKSGIWKSGSPLLYSFSLRNFNSHFETIGDNFSLKVLLEKIITKVGCGTLKSSHTLFIFVNFVKARWILFTGYLASSDRTSTFLLLVLITLTFSPMTHKFTWQSIEKVTSANW